VGKIPIILLSMLLLAPAGALHPQASKAVGGDAGVLIVYSDGSFKLSLTAACQASPGLVRLRARGVTNYPGTYHFESEMLVYKRYLPLSENSSIFVNLGIEKTMDRVVDGVVQVNVTTPKGMLYVNTYRVTGRYSDGRARVTFEGVVNAVGEYREKYLYNLLEMLSENQTILVRHGIFALSEFYMQGDGSYYMEVTFDISRNATPVEILPPEVSYFIPYYLILDVLVKYQAGTVIVTAADNGNGTVSVAFMFEVASKSGKAWVNLPDVAGLLPVPGSMWGRMVEFYFENSTITVEGGRVNLSLPRMKFVGVDNVTEAVSIMAGAFKGCNATVKVIPGDSGVSAPVDKASLNDLPKIHFTQERQASTPSPPSNTGSKPQTRGLVTQPGKQARLDRKLALAVLVSAAVALGTVVARRLT
jgi:hypothetical protein